MAVIKVLWKTFTFIKIILEHCALVCKVRMIFVFPLFTFNYLSWRETGEEMPSTFLKNVTMHDLIPRRRKFLFFKARLLSL